MIDTIKKEIPETLMPIEEFWNLLEKQTEVSLKQIDYLSDKDVNHRFHDVKCAKETAISIGGRYLHANEMGTDTIKRLVAAQMPLPEDLETFWRAIFNKNFTILDLTTTKDLKKRQLKKYYPENLEEIHNYGSMFVKLIEKTDDLCTYMIKDALKNEEKKIQRLHYTHWPDFGIISTEALNQLIQRVEDVCEDSKQPLWVHCLAGVGRTGSLMTALILKEKITSKEITLENLEDKLIEILIKLRKQRNGMIAQNKYQLNLMRVFACEHLSK